MAITVRYGVNSLALTHLSGKTISEIRCEMESALNIPPSAQVRINGSVASETDTVGENASVEFVKTAGEKGSFVRSL